MRFKKTYIEKTELIERQEQDIIDALEKHPKGLTEKELLFYIGYSFIDPEQRKNNLKKLRLQNLLDDLICQKKIKKIKKRFLMSGK